MQNADDAEATKVIFLFDKSQHSKDQLWTSELGQFQGPALYAYNDAVFKPPDWYNIQHPEQSGKVDELTKVGRFGLGFISVYHLTGQLVLTLYSYYCLTLLLDTILNLHRDKEFSFNL